MPTAFVCIFACVTLASISYAFPTELLASLFCVMLPSAILSIETKAQSSSKSLLVVSTWPAISEGCSEILPGSEST